MSGDLTSARAFYRRTLKDRVKIARATGTGAAANIAWDQSPWIPAHVSGFSREEGAGGMIQGEQTVMLNAQILDRVWGDSPPREKDRVLMPNGNIAIVQACDANTRRMEGVTLAYVCRVIGQG